MKVLITGSSGQLAKEFIKFFTNKRVDFIAPTEIEFDITNPVSVDTMLAKYTPDYVINCAAFNDVDGAEADSTLAYLINAKAVEHLAAQCDKNNITLIHFGTDYVFDGKKRSLYIESDKTNPLTAYGKSKLEGEKYVLNYKKNIVFRVSWLIGNGTQNYIAKLLTWSQKSDTINTTSDEVSVPTFAKDVVEFVFKAITQKISGLYHLTNMGYCSRYILAKTFAEYYGLKNTILPVPIASFNLLAKRPLFSPMSNKLISQTLGITMPTWQDSLKIYIETLKANG